MYFGSLLFKFSNLCYGLFIVLKELFYRVESSIYMLGLDIYF